MRILFFFVLCIWLLSPSCQKRETDNLQIYILAGQSNMSGRGVPLEEIDRTIHPRIFVFTRDNRWIPARDPLHFDSPNCAAGPGFTFAKMMAAHDTLVKIGLVPVAVGGSKIQSWQKGQPLYNNLLYRVNLSRKDGRLAGILWHQGEADCREDRIENYQARLTAFITDIRNDLGSPDLPFICGELGQWPEALSEGDIYIPQMNNIIAKMPGLVKNVGFVSSQGLQNMSRKNGFAQNDLIHFSPAAARELGRRYAAEMIKILETAKK